jgi:hypothetical protein
VSSFVSTQAQRSNECKESKGKREMVCLHGWDMSVDTTSASICSTVVTILLDHHYSESMSKRNLLKATVSSEKSSVSVVIEKCAL